MMIKKCATLYLDLAKVFDTIDYDILILKLKQLGVCGNILKFFSTENDVSKLTKLSVLYVK